MTTVVTDSSQQASPASPQGVQDAGVPFESLAALLVA